MVVSITSSLSHVRDFLPPPQHTPAVPSRCLETPDFDAFSQVIKVTYS